MNLQQLMSACPNLVVIPVGDKPTAAATAMKALRDAIAAFDAGSAERAQQWDAIENNADLEAAEAADLKALETVREAFWQLTKDRNSRAHCSIVGIEFMRRIAQLDPAKFEVSP